MKGNKATAKDMLEVRKVSGKNEGRRLVIKSMYQHDKSSLFQAVLSIAV